MTDSARAALHLTGDPIISRSKHESLARMLREVREKRFKAGETIYRRHADADMLYLAESGTVELAMADGKRVAPAGTRFGEEAATDVPCYLADAVALTDVVAFAVPRACLAALDRENPGNKAEFYFSLLANFGGEVVRSASAPPRRKPKGRDGIEAVGWLLAILIPAAIMFLAGEWGVGREVRTFLAIFAAAIVMWVFELVDEYVPGLFAVLMILALGLAPPKVALAGFASDGFFMAMSVLGLGTVLVSSGLSFRCLLWLLRYLPGTHTGLNAGLLITGTAITPVIPSNSARTAMLVPFLIDMVESVKFRFRGRAATRLAVSAFTGVTLFAAMFLTSRSINFVIYGMLSPQEQQQFSWLYWLFAGAVPAAAMLALYAAGVALFFRSDETPALSKQQVDVQLRLLGRLKRREWASIAGIGLFIVGILTTSIHNVQPPWLGMAILYGLLLYGYLNRREFREKTDWPALVYLGTLVGVIGTFNYLGLDRWLTTELSGLADVLRTSFGVFVALLFGLVLVLRFAFPSSATIAICATIFMPVASQAGVSPWVVGFMLLTFSDMWIFPFQSPQYQQFQELLRDKRLYDERAFLRFNLFVNALRLAGVYAAIPFWERLGLV